MERKDWHQLSKKERELVTALQEFGFLIEKDEPEDYIKVMDSSVKNNR